MRGTDLVRPVRGVYLSRTTDLDFSTRCRAALLVASPDAFLSAATAARVIGIPLPARLQKSTTVDVGVPAPASPPEGRGLRGHCLEIEESEITTVDGMRATTPEETWCSLASRLSLTELVAAGDFLIHHAAPLTTMEALELRVRAWRGKRGVRRLRHALGLLNPRSESPKESELRVVLVESGIQGVEANFPVVTSGGYRYRADLAIPARKLIVEYQSAFHETPEAFRADMTRISRLEADQWKVIQVNKEDLRDPFELVARIRRVLHSRPHS